MRAGESGNAHLRIILHGKMETNLLRNVRSNPITPESKPRSKAPERKDSMRKFRQQWTHCHSFSRQDTGRIPRRQKLLKKLGSRRNWNTFESCVLQQNTANLHFDNNKIKQTNLGGTIMRVGRYSVRRQAGFQWIAFGISLRHVYTVHGIRNLEL